MLGLILKDFVSQKIYVGYAVAYIVLMGYICLAAGSDTNDGGAPALLIVTLGTVFVFFGGSMLPDMARDADRKSGWDMFALTLPTAARKAVLAKYLVMLGLYVVCFVVSTICSALGAAMSDSVDFSIFLPLTIFGFVVAFDSVSYAFIFRFGPKRGGVFKAVFVLAVPFMAIMYLFFGDLTVFGENGLADFFEWVLAFNFTDFIASAWYWFLLAALACWSAGYAFSRKGYRAGLEDM